MEGGRGLHSPVNPPPSSPPLSRDVHPPVSKPLCVDLTPAVVNDVVDLNIDPNFKDLDDHLLLDLHDDSYAPSPVPCSCCSQPLASCKKYIADMVEIIYQIDRSGLPNQDGTRIPLQNSNLNFGMWSHVLSGYFDRQPILDGIRYGWDLSLVGNPTPKDARRNHPSALNHRDDTQEYISKELAHGCLVGPISSPPFSVACSPLGSVPKTGSSTQRTITDCSFNGRGINSWIPQQWYRGSPCKILLPGTKDIVASIQKIRAKFPGQKILGFKMDLSRYYRNIWVDPGQARHLGIRWEGKVYIDLVFSFGNRAAMVPAQRMAEALAWYVRSKTSPDGVAVNSGISCSCNEKCSCGDNEILPYVDDFIGIAPASHADHLWSSLMGLVSSLGLKPSATPGHLCPPASSFVGLGVQFDLEKNTASIPPDKLAETKSLVSSWLEKSFATKRELQQVLGKLLHVSRVVRPGRLHVSRMLDTLRRAYNLSSPVPLDSCFKADLAWWNSRLDRWNGISTLVFTAYHNKVALDASTDGWADGSPGLGGFNFLANEYFKCSVPDYIKDWHICDLELLAHLLCCHLWGHSFCGAEIHGLTDNEPCEWFLKNGRSRIDSRLQMGRTLTAMEHEWGFLWVPDGIRSKQNVLPDCLSRWGSLERQDLFWSTIRSMGINPTERVIEPYMFDIYFDSFCSSVSE